jgi:ribose transport system permease protein
VRAILNDRAPIVAQPFGVDRDAIGEFDMSLGYMVGLTHILAVGLQTRQELPWFLVVLIVLGMLVGLINGLLVHVAKILLYRHLGMGTTLYGISIGTPKWRQNRRATGAALC